MIYSLGYIDILNMARYLFYSVACLERVLTTFFDRKKYIHSAHNLFRASVALREIIFQTVFNELFR